ncbi:MAG: DUF5658 family protein [Candidatus Cloacimonetes bacterium]|nr:DUF5658 family protein [Candidatus Cloacimonadota bacterium]
MLAGFWLYVASLSVFLALNALDVHSTWLVVKYSSIRSERNPLARMLLRKLGPLWGLLALKGVILLILPLIVLWWDDAPTQMTLILLAADIAYALVVANNYRIYRRLRRQRSNFTGQSRNSR